MSVGGRENLRRWFLRNKDQIPWLGFYWEISFRQYNTARVKDGDWSRSLSLLCLKLKHNAMRWKNVLVEFLCIAFHFIHKLCRAQCSNSECNFKDFMSIYDSLYDSWHDIQRTVTKWHKEIIRLWNGEVTEYKITLVVGVRASYFLDSVFGIKVGYLYRHLIIELLENWTVSRKVKYGSTEVFSQAGCSISLSQNTPSFRITMSLCVYVGMYEFRRFLPAFEIL